nr:uncharacterized protein LOC109158085 [Ipomoea batatas]
MDVGNGWRPTPAASRDKTIINRMMLRFRPIAPKPAADTPSTTTTTTPASSGSKSKDLMGWRDGSGRVVESWVMVDGMTDTWVDGGELGYSDTEKMKNLERDSCPALISDALNRVQWVNPAYRKLTAKMQSKTMPCDVWKMEFGGLAWRLDAKAALCLGR